MRTKLYEESIFFQNYFLEKERDCYFSNLGIYYGKEDYDGKNKLPFASNGNSPN